ncbi:uracil-DNA glycosylase [Metamycoplasma canadense]|nr:uracil-DNA glycosylase [Metamycoplasma canadense]
MKFKFKDFLISQKKEKYWKNIEIILKKKNLVPKKELVFNAFLNFDFNEIKLVIIGQDPYPTNNNADGLCFSSNNKKTPSSLKNIFLEIKNSYPNSEFKTNNLQYWKNQGVLLLNSILTTEKNKTLAHKNQGWEIFNINLLSEILKEKHDVLFLAMGKDALLFLNKLDIDKMNIFSTPHPSPLSCWRGFFNSNVFKKINDKLKSLNKKEIDWNTK